MEPVYKTPSEKIALTVDWTDRIDSTLTISTCTGSVQNLETGADVSSSMLLATSGTISSLTTTHTTKAYGNDGDRFLVTYTATCSDSTVWQAYHELKVVAPHA